MTSPRRLMLAIVTVVLLMAAKDYAWPQSPWVDQLRNGVGGTGEQCCSNNDGLRIGPPDWDTGKTEAAPYKVKRGSEWLDVPSYAVVTGRNQDGIARVWYYSEPDVAGNWVKCFLPGALS